MTISWKNGVGVSLILLPATWSLVRRCGFYGSKEQYCQATRHQESNHPIDQFWLFHGKAQRSGKNWSG
jgi:hypothetical protein